MAAIKKAKCFIILFFYKNKQTEQGGTSAPGAKNPAEKRGGEKLHLTVKANKSIVQAN